MKRCCVIPIPIPVPIPKPVHNICHYTTSLSLHNIFSSLHNILRVIQNVKTHHLYTTSIHNICNTQHLYYATSALLWSHPVGVRRRWLKPSAAARHGKIVRILPLKIAGIDAHGNFENAPFAIALANGIHDDPIWHAVAATPPKH